MVPSTPAPSAKAKVSAPLPPARLVAPLNVTVPTRSMLLRVPAFWLVMFHVLDPSEATREIGLLGLPIKLTGLPVVRASTVAPPVPVWTVTLFESEYLYWM